MGLHGTQDDGRHIESGEIARHCQERRHHTEDGDFLFPLPDGQPYHEGCGLPHVVFGFLLFFCHIFLSCLLSRGICGCNGIVSQIPAIWCRGDEIAGWGDEIRLYTLPEGCYNEITRYVGAALWKEVIACLKKR